MSLPIGGEIPWPPPELDPVDRKLREWSAWYSGSSDALESFYSTVGPYTNSLSRSFYEQDRPRGGPGAASMPRTFWGQPLQPGTQRAKLHVPLASDIAEISANLLFSDLPKLASADSATQKTLDSFQTDGLHASLREAAETCAALGGTYLKVVWDASLADHPWLCAVSPKLAVPTWTWDRLRSVTFWSVLHQDKDVTLRLLECHEPGFISYGLYKGKPTELGERIALSAFDGTANLEALYGPNGVVPTGLSILTAMYIPNVRPHRVWGDLNVAANLGRSDYAVLEPLLDALDETYSSWMRDIRLAKARIIVPQSMLETEGPGQGALFNVDKEVFVGVRSLDDEITMNQFAIRVTEHRDTAQMLFEQIVSSAGYSLQSFGGKGDVAVTATEVQARKEQSLTTRGQKILYWRPALQQILRALLGIDRLAFGGKGKPDADISVEFPAAVQPSLKDIAETLSVLRQAEAASTRTRVILAHPDWTKAQVDAEVAAIIGEATKPTAGPSTAPRLPDAA